MGTMLETIQKEIELMEKGKKLLTKLYFHHNSQGKPNRVPVSISYHRDLAEELYNLLWPSLKNKGGRK